MNALPPEPYVFVTLLNATTGGLASGFASSAIIGVPPLIPTCLASATSAGSARCTNQRPEFPTSIDPRTSRESGRAPGFPDSRCSSRTPSITPRVLAMGWASVCGWCRIAEVPLVNRHLRSAVGPSSHGRAIGRHNASVVKLADTLPLGGSA